MYCNLLSSHWPGWNEYPMLNSRPMRKHGLSSISVFVILYSHSVSGRPRNCESTNATAVSLQGGGEQHVSTAKWGEHELPSSKSNRLPYGKHWPGSISKDFRGHNVKFTFFHQHKQTTKKSGYGHVSCFDFGQDMPRLRNVLSDTIPCERNHPLDHHQVCRSWTLHLDSCMPRAKSIEW